MSTTVTQCERLIDRGSGLELLKIHNHLEVQLRHGRRTVNEGSCMENRRSEKRTTNKHGERSESMVL